MTMRRIIALTITTLMMGASLSVADVIDDRKAGFRSNVTALKAIRAAMNEGDAATVAQNAEKIADWFAVMTEYFPEGSGNGNTNARPEIWTEWDKFTALATASEKTARDLAANASMGDMDAIPQGFKVVAGTCKTCHQSFKN